jgi:hypothetical protein
VAALIEQEFGSVFDEENLRDARRKNDGSGEASA